MESDKERDDLEASQLPEAPKLEPNLPKRPRQGPTQSQDEYRRMGIAYTIPAALVAPIVILTLLGAWLDNRFKWSPYGVMIGALLGFVTGMMNMIRMSNKL